MVNYQQLPIYRDVYVLLTEIYQDTDKFPRSCKYTLGQDMKRDALNLFRYISVANISVERRGEALSQFLEAFELLKIEIRLCVDLNIMSIKKLAQLSLLTDGIAKQASAWRRGTRKKMTASL